MPRRASSALSSLRACFRLPHGWPDAVRQVAIWVAVDAFYEVVRGLTEGSDATALANGRAVVDIERATGTFFEVDLQQAVLPHTWIIHTADFLYMNAHLLVCTGFLTWLYLRRNETFYFVRNMFIAGMGLACVVHAILPTAPPRLLPQYGFVDTIQRFAHVNQDSGAISSLVNKYAAVPSMHVGFALIVGVTAAALARRRRTKVLFACYPLLVLFVVMVTGNHFWLDGLAGAAVAGVCALLARGPLTALRPDVWAWRVAPREREHGPAPARV
ncbi:MAG: phosphatase PAP2 family protein [Actinomycetota bacterium]|nr:phosphatase PAP2 family protein [Actinomycetota bacterium]